MASSSRTTGNDSIEGVDPGGTLPTKPGNPDKGGPAKLANVSKEQTVKSGNRNNFADRKDG